MSVNYWKEFVAEMAEEWGASPTDEQLTQAAKECSRHAEMYSEASGHLCIHNPMQTELEQVKRELANERRMEVCPECLGRGSIHESFGPIGRSSSSTCHKCGGKGKRIP